MTSPISLGTYSLQVDVATATLSRAYRAAAFTYANTGYQKIAVDTVSFGVSAPWVGRAGAYTAPSTGYYQVNAQVRRNVTAIGDLVATALAKNGTVIAEGAVDTAQAVTSPAMVVSDIVQMTAGDYIEIFSYNSNGTPTMVAGGSIDNYMSVYRIL